MTCWGQMMSDNHWTTIINNGITPPNKGSTLAGIWFFISRGIIVLAMLKVASLIL